MEELSDMSRLFLQCLADAHAVPPISDESRLVLAELESFGVYPKLTDEKLDEFHELSDMIDEVFNKAEQKE